MTLSLTLFASTLSGIASAQEIKKQEEKEIKEIAEQLEFIFEKAAIKDTNGKLIGLDIKMIEEKYGPSPELDQLKQEMEIGSNPPISMYSRAVDDCLERKIKDGFGDLIGISAITTIITYITDGEYEKAAKKLIKIGIRGNAIAIAGTLYYYFGTCLWEEEGWTGKS